MLGLAQLEITFLKVASGGVWTPLPRLPVSVHKKRPFSVILSQGPRDMGCRLCKAGVGVKAVAGAAGQEDASIRYHCNSSEAKAQRRKPLAGVSGPRCLPGTRVTWSILQETPVTLAQV